MAPPAPIAQNGLYYFGIWTRANEKIALGYLHNEWFHGRLRMTGSSTGEDFVVSLHSFMDRGGTYTERGEVWRKFREWRRRYNNFSRLIGMRSVRYDAARNEVTARDGIWDYLAKYDEELLCYMDEGEENWRYLKDIFTIPEEDYDAEETADNMGGNGDHGQGNDVIVINSDESDEI